MVSASCRRLGDGIPSRYARTAGSIDPHCHVGWRDTFGRCDTRGTRRSCSGPRRRGAPRRRISWRWRGRSQRTRSRRRPAELGMASIERLRADAASCTRCDLYRHATQTVFGEGPAHPRLVMIGEQPGDKEDLAGHPFVGPAGQLLGRAFDAAGIERDAVYLTNAVKHFKWKRGTGKVRLHQKPTREEVRACASWWEAELDALGPDLVVLLGATAAAGGAGPTGAGHARPRRVFAPARRRVPYDYAGDGAPVGGAADPTAGARRRVRGAGPRPPSRCAARRSMSTGQVSRRLLGLGVPRLARASCTRRTYRNAGGSRATPPASTPSSSTPRSTDCRRPPRSSTGRAGAAGLRVRHEARHRSGHIA